MLAPADVEKAIDPESDQLVGFVIAAGHVQTRFGNQPSLRAPELRLRK